MLFISVLESHSIKYVFRSRIDLSECLTLTAIDLYRYIGLVEEEMSADAAGLNFMDTSNTGLALVPVY